MNRVTEAELQAGLAHVLDAAADEGVIEMLCQRPDYGQRHFVAQIQVTRAQGIAGDRWLKHPWLRLPDGSPHPGIQICILSRRVLDLVWRDRKTVTHPGDTFITDMDLSEDNLPAGQLLAAGSAVLRVSGIFNDGCVKWAARYGKAARAWINLPEHRAYRLRGILCSVERDGLLRNGDPVRKL